MTTNKALTIPTYNQTSPTWDVPLNANFTSIDQALGGVQAFNLGTASGTIAVTATTYAGSYPSNTASYVPLTWALTGALGGNVVLQIPAGVGGEWIVENNTSAAHTVTISSAGGGSSVIVNQGTIRSIFSDGTNVNFADAQQSGVSGPSSSTSGNIATFNGTSGAVIQDSGIAASGGTISATVLSGNVAAERMSTNIISALGFTPVQQGGGAGQQTDKIYIGWTGSQIGLQVDVTSFGSTWPISITGNAGYASYASAIPSSYGAVGTYLYAATDWSLAPGNTISGGSIYAHGINGSGAGGTMAGSWIFLGASTSYIGLFLRYA